MRLSDWRKECDVRFRRLYEENLSNIYSSAKLLVARQLSLDIFVPIPKIPILFLLIQLRKMNLGESKTYLNRANLQNKLPLPCN